MEILPDILSIAGLVAASVVGLILIVLFYLRGKESNSN